eukprot:867380-Prymnesium_polylepis.1
MRSRDPVAVRSCASPPSVQPGAELQARPERMKWKSETTDRTRLAGRTTVLGARNTVLGVDPGRDPVAGRGRVRCDCEDRGSSHGKVEPENLL